MAQDQLPITDPLAWNPHAAPPADGVRLSDLVAGIARRWWLVLIGLAVGLGTVGYLVQREEPEFRSTATLWLPRPANGGNSLGGFGSLMGLGAGGASVSELELFHSHGFGGEVVDSLGLRLEGVDGSEGLVEAVRVEADAPNGPIELAFEKDGVHARAGAAMARAPYGRRFRVRGVWMRVPGRPAVDAARFEVVARDAAIGRFQENFFVRQRDRTEMVDVGITAPSPVLAERATNTAVDLFRAARARNAEAEVQERAQRLRDQIAFNDSSLRAAQMQLVAFRGSQQTYSAGALYQTREAERMALETETEQLSQERSTLAALRDGLRAGAEQDRGIDALVASPGVTAKPLIGQLYNTLLQYQTRRDTMTAGRWGKSATHPDVRRLDELIADTKTRLSGAVESELRALDTQIATARTRSSRTEAMMQPLPAADARQDDLARQIDGLTKMSLMLREEYTRQQLATSGDSIRVVDRALPGWKVNGDLLQMIILGIFGGLVMGMASAAVLTTLDTTLRTGEDVERALDLAVLATVPRAGGWRRRPKTPVFHARGAEAYRTLRTNLRFSRVAPDARTLVVASAEAGEGRSTVAANLAVAVARQGGRVLLVDCDLARATLHPLFGADRAPGITDLLLGDVTCEQAVRATRTEGVFLLPAGTPVGRSASEVLQGGAMQGTLAELATRFDLLILDTPPLATDTAGTATVAAAADGVILVVRAGQTRREPARAALRQLAAVRARVVGAVLNDAGSAPAERPGTSPEPAAPARRPARVGVAPERVGADSESRA